MILVEMTPSTKLTPTETALSDRTLYSLFCAIPFKLKCSDDFGRITRGHDIVWNRSRDHRTRADYGILADGNAFEHGDIVAEEYVVSDDDGC